MMKFDTSWMEVDYFDMRDKEDSRPTFSQRKKDMLIPPEEYITISCWMKRTVLFL